MARPDLDARLLHELVVPHAEGADPVRAALTLGEENLGYGALDQRTRHLAAGLLGLGLTRAGRVGVWLEKRFETVIACFGAAAAGGVFVPVNPLLKPAQVEHIVRDCGMQVLVTSAGRLALLRDILPRCPELRHVITVDADGEDADASRQLPSGLTRHDWAEVLDSPARAGHRVIDADVATILYTSGSTGRPKGVVLSHRNLVAGAQSVSAYLENGPDDVLLAVLPLSFDAGFSQLTTALRVGARVVLLNHLLPRDVLIALERHRVTGLTAVPPLFTQLAPLEWPATVAETLRYFASTGGRMPGETLARLRQRLPRTQPFLMYGLTEAFRSTYLPPAEVDRRPDSIGKAIPNAEILVLRGDGSECGVGEPGELVHRGPLVAMGYWNDPEATAQRFRPLPAGLAARPHGLPQPEIAVYSGDVVRKDAEGYLYFVSRRDEMIKTSGYRISPGEVEEVVQSTGLVGECVAFGVEHPVLGQVIQVVATAPPGGVPPDLEGLLAHCRNLLPSYMLPAAVDVLDGPLPRNPNGKFDRALIAEQWSLRRSVAL